MCKVSILDVWQGSEYASELASKGKDVLFLTDNLLLGKTKRKEPNKLQDSWTKMLLNRTNSYTFACCGQTLANIIEIFQKIYHVHLHFT